MNENIVDDIALLSDQPTMATFDELHHWVMWQLPRKVQGGSAGAVRPTLSGHKWYAAIIHLEKRQVSIMAHEGQLFDSPETAVSHLMTMKK